jgi:hypothetical protein
VILRVSANESEISSLNSRVYSRLESNVDSVILRVSANESGVSSLSTRLSGFESNVDSVVVRVSAVESNVSEIKTVVYTLFDGNPADPNYSSLQLINAELLVDIDDYNVDAVESRLSYLEGVVSQLTTAP